jgi:SAM-dependent methyltransferase
VQRTRLWDVGGPWRFHLDRDFLLSDSRRGHPRQSDLIGRASLQNISSPMSHSPAELFRAFDGDPKPVTAFLLSLAEGYCLRRSPRVLDIGCGTGRMLPPLAALGWRVTGMEPHPAFRAYAQQLAPAGAQVRPGGFCDVSADEEFDLIAGINGSFAHLLTAEERVDALSRCWRALVPNGVLLLDLPNLLRILKEYSEPAERRAELGGRTIRLLRRHVVDYDRAAFITYEEYWQAEETGMERLALTLEHSYAVTAYPDLAFLIRQAGFEELRTYASYAARAPERLGPGRMIVAARRPRRA